MDKCLAHDSDPHKIRGMYIMGENPAMSDPDLNHAREALCALEHLVVQDIFMTETAWLRRRRAARQRVAGEDRHGDQHRPHGADWASARWTCPATHARTCGSSSRSPRAWACAWNYEGEESGVAAVYEEMRQAMHEVIGGISWERLMQRIERHLSLPERRRSGPANGVHRRLPDRRTAA